MVLFCVGIEHEHMLRTLKKMAIFLLGRFRKSLLLYPDKLGKQVSLRQSAEHKQQRRLRILTSEYGFIDQQLVQRASHTRDLSIISHKIRFSSSCGSIPPANNSIEEVDCDLLEEVLVLVPDLGESKTICMDPLSCRMCFRPGQTVATREDSNRCFLDPAEIMILQPAHFDEAENGPFLQTTWVNQYLNFLSTTFACILAFIQTLFVWLWKAAGLIALYLAGIIQVLSARTMWEQCMSLFVAYQLVTRVFPTMGGEDGEVELLKAVTSTVAAGSASTYVLMIPYRQGMCKLSCLIEKKSVTDLNIG
ncbi:hypothetical protein B0O99DRAFT_627527 [Bisporella sp. PMI_857]|nr:hypothetical protein B0O99DRAFT_627527 [Bisporella sp. PMI_857]